MKSIADGRRTWASAAAYYPNGALKQFIYGNGVVHSMLQNARQLPLSVVDGGTLDHYYTYDENGNIVGIADVVQGANYNRSMAYDDLDRLLTAASPSFGGDGVHRFTYDALDNLKSWKLAGVKDFANYYYHPGNHRLASIQNTVGATVVGLDYDPQGNLSIRNGQGYAFDFGNRLRKVNGKEDAYRYDAYGRRVFAAAASGAIHSLYNHEGQLLWERDERSGKRNQNVYLAGSLIGVRSRPIGTDVETITFRHTDALGSPVAVTNAAGQVIERIQYEPYGALVNKAGYQGIGYTGHVMDAATGLTYMQQRYYDPAIGRFLSVDPVTADGNTGANFNRYWYANNNPYKFTDPDGRQACAGTLCDWYREVSRRCEMTCVAKGVEGKPKPKNEQQTLPAGFRLAGSYPNFGKKPSAHPFQTNDPRFANQCAIRCSVALMGAGFDLSGYPQSNTTPQGWARSAKGLADYLEVNVGKPQLIKWADFVNPRAPVNYSNMQGIVFFRGVNGSSDHIDVVYKGTFGSGVYETPTVKYWPAPNW